MSAWGKADNKTASGTVAIDTDGVVTGTGTSFTTQASVGDYLRADGKNFIIKAITSNTAATVINADPELGAFTAVSSGTAYTLSEKPTSLASDPNTLASEVFGVRSNEIHGDQSGGYISAVALIQGGTGYLETPSVAFSGGGGSGAAATATIANGSVTAVTVTNNGSSYETAPTVNIDVPRRTIPTSGVTTATDTITYNSHGITSGEAVKYYNGGGTSITGLTSGTTYYAGQVNTNTLKLYNTAQRASTAIADQVIATSAVNTTANTITITDHGLVDGAQMNYNNQGGSSIGGLTSGNDYFVIVVDEDTIQLEDTVDGGAKDLTTTGNNSQTLASTGRLDLSGTGNNAQYLDLIARTTATANAALGVNQGDEVGESGAVAHTGWVKRKVLTGQHAGRIQYEVLVAMSKNGITGDASDDIQFPED